MKPRFANAVEALEDLAPRVWWRLYDGERLGIRQGEVSLTDYVLLELVRSGVPGIVVVKTALHNEKDTGTDWEWWIGSDRKGWLRYAVQAKRLSVEEAGGNRYHALAHPVRDEQQIDVLKRVAQNNNAIPLYCFYNELEWMPLSERPKYWHCTEPPDWEQLGCTVVALTTVEAALSTRGGRTFEGIHDSKDSRPWRCLVRCQEFLNQYSDGVNQPAARPRFPLASQDTEIKIYPSLPAGLLESARSGEPMEFPGDLYAGASKDFPRQIAVLDIDSRATTSETAQ